MQIFLDSCAAGDVRLLRATAEPPRMLIVEVCHNENYSTICSQSWGNEEASVVCTQLGFSSRGELMHVSGSTMQYKKSVHAWYQVYITV